MAIVEVLYWRGIPVQVRARGTTPRERASVMLSDRFQAAADAAAMALRQTEGELYLANFAWGEPQERSGTPHEAAHALAVEIEARYPGEIDWRTLVDSPA